MRQRVKEKDQEKVKRKIIAAREVKKLRERERKETEPRRGGTGS